MNARIRMHEYCCSYLGAIYAKGLYLEICISSTSHMRILVYIICLISIRNSVSDGTRNKSVLNIESSLYD